MTVTNYCVNVDPLFLHVQIAKTRKVKNTQLIARNFLLNAFTNPSQLDGRSRVSSRSPLHLFHIHIRRRTCFGHLLLLLFSFLIQRGRMESLLKDFNVDPKRPSEEALRRWRKAVTIVKNRRRRFRMVADLAKRSEAEKKRRSIQVCSWQSHSQHSPRFCLRHALNSYF